MIQKNFKNISTEMVYNHNMKFIYYKNGSFWRKNAIHIICEGATVIRIILTEPTNVQSMGGWTCLADSWKCHKQTIH